MPIFEFKCSVCKKVFEEWVKDYERNKKLTECPKCGMDAFKIMSVGSFKVNGANAANGYAGDK